MATTTTNNATPPDPSQVTFNPAVSMPAPTTPTPSVGMGGPKDTSNYVNSNLPPVAPVVPVAPVAPVAPLKTVQNSFQNADGTITVVYSDGTTSTSGTPIAKGPSASDQSALGAITDILGQAGLGSVATTAWAQLNAGVPVSQIISDIRSGNSLYGDAYAQRFPGMAALAAKGQAINEGTYINLEKSYTEILQSTQPPY